MAVAAAFVSDIGQVSELFRAPTVQEIQLRRDAYTRISLAAHSWKLQYFSLHPKGMTAGASAPDARNKNVWERLATSDLPQFNRDNWVRFYPLFKDHLEYVRRELQEAHAAYANVLEPSTRSMIEATRLQLNSDWVVYSNFPRSNIAKDYPNAYAGLFSEVFLTLGKLDSEVQRLRDDLPAPEASEIGL